MSAPQRKRYVCPLCEAGILAPGRMARDDIRRFCLDCSERTGKLVARVSPMLERQHQRSKDRAAKKAAAKRRREAPKRQQVMTAQRRAMKIQNEFAAAQRAYRARLVKLTEEVDTSDVALDTEGWTSISDSLVIWCVQHGVPLKLHRDSHERPFHYMPMWAFWLHNSCRLSTKVVRWIVKNDEARAALQAASATGDRESTVRLAFELYPFPHPEKKQYA